ncbi:retrotransposon nucleocapsid related protein [Cyclospora cayetanensis]|uniref:Retrotransposon nucleocapsid related protein n=1 Tax=Cyclospora cayetanensis TaxID=88456 RepID=A0A1D3CX92_9EIME|nr:retrotransposon nucleocapsid related protein [Cyclospora cayetanensis]
MLRISPTWSPTRLSNATESYFCEVQPLVSAMMWIVSTFDESSAFDTHATATIAKIQSGRRMNRSRVEIGLLCFKTERVFCHSYIWTSLRSAGLPKAHDPVLLGHGGVSITVQDL